MAPTGEERGGSIFCRHAHSLLSLAYMNKARAFKLRLLVDSSAVCEGCLPCDCDAGGSDGADCDQLTGQCVCLPGTTGTHCNQYVPCNIIIIIISASVGIFQRKEKSMKKIKIQTLIRAIGDKELSCKSTAL